MDQAIEILALQGTAKLIEFNPLRTFDVRLPEGGSFVISNSLAEKNKAEGADYNTRVAECKAAALVLAKGLGLENPAKKPRKFSDVQEESGLDLKAMLAKVDDVLREGAYSKFEICAIMV